MEKDKKEYLLVSTSGGKVEFWDISSRDTKFINFITSESGELHSFFFTENELIVEIDNKPYTKWDISDFMKPTKVQTIGPIPYSIFLDTTFAMTKDLRLLFSCTSGNIPFKKDICKNKLSTFSKYNQSFIRYLQPKTLRLYMGGQNSIISEYYCNSQKLIFQISNYKSQILHAITSNESGSKMYFGFNCGSVISFNPKTKQLQSIIKHPKSILTLFFNNKGSEIFVGTWEKTKFEKYAIDQSK